MKVKVVLPALISSLIFGAFFACSSIDHPAFLQDYVPPIKDATAKDVIAEVNDTPCYSHPSSFPKVLDSSANNIRSYNLTETPDASVLESENGITYHGGPVMHGTVNIYYIWYGDWDPASKKIIIDLANNIGGSSYYDINTLYYSIESNNNSHITSTDVNIFNSEQPRHLRTIGSPPDYEILPKAAPMHFEGTRNYVSNSVKYIGSCEDKYSFGKSLTELNIASIVTSAIESNVFPLDPNGVYFVLTSGDVSQTYKGAAFCNGFCGWHFFTEFKDVTIKFSFVGDTVRCPERCSVFELKEHSKTEYITPNDNLTADGMVSVIAHELVEMVTDPELNAWYDDYAWENADKCSWNFGDLYTLKNGSKANLRLGDRDYLIQQNWVNLNNGYCGIRK